MSVLARVPVDRITAAAAQVRARPVLQAGAAGLLYGAGRAAYVVLRALLRTLGVVLWAVGAGGWTVLTWCATAVRLGWVDARDAAQTRAVARTRAAQEQR